MVMRIRLCKSDARLVRTSRGLDFACKVTTGGSGGEEDEASPACDVSLFMKLLLKNHCCCMCIRLICLLKGESATLCSCRNWPRNATCPFEDR